MSAIWDYPLPSFHCCSFPLRRSLFSDAVQKSSQNSMPNVKSHLNPQFVTACTTQREPEGFSSECGIRQNVRSMLHCFFFQEGQITSLCNHPCILSGFIPHLEKESMLFHYSIWRLNDFPSKGLRPTSNVFLSHTIFLYKQDLCVADETLTAYAGTSRFAVFCVTCLDASAMCQLQYMYADG